MQPCCMTSTLSHIASFSLIKNPKSQIYFLLLYLIFQREVRQGTTIGMTFSFLFSKITQQVVFKSKAFEAIKRMGMRHLGWAVVGGLHVLTT